jgi:hypothetical protein
VLRSARVYYISDRPRVYQHPGWFHERFGLLEDGRKFFADSQKLMNIEAGNVSSWPFATFRC